MQTPHIPLAMPLIALALLGCASSLTAADCAENSLHSSSGPPQDLGRGLVGQDVLSTGFQSPDATWVLSQQTLFDCAEGRQATLLRQHGSTDGAIDINHSEEVAALMQDVSSFEAALADATAASIPVDVTSTAETCGCRVYYPELRGSKNPYEVTG